MLKLDKQNYRGNLKQCYLLLSNNLILQLSHIPCGDGQMKINLMFAIFQSIVNITVNPSNRCYLKIDSTKNNEF